MIFSHFFFICSGPQNVDPRASQVEALEKDAAWANKETNSLKDDVVALQEENSSLLSQVDPFSLDTLFLSRSSLYSFMSEDTRLKPIGIVRDSLGS